MQNTRGKRKLAQGVVKLAAKKFKLSHQAIYYRLYHAKDEKIIDFCISKHKELTEKKQNAEMKLKTLIEDKDNND